MINTQEQCVLTQILFPRSIHPWLYRIFWPVFNPSGSVPKESILNSLNNALKDEMLELKEKMETWRLGGHISLICVGRKNEKQSSARRSA